MFFVAHNLRPKPPPVNAALATKRHRDTLSVFFEEQVAEEGFICRTTGLDVVVELETCAEVGY